MKTFRFFWTAHKWAGIMASVFVLVVASSGLLLLLKKDFAWIQPPTRQGAPAELSEFLSMGQLWERVRAIGHADFRREADIERVDVRPAKRVYKVRSKHNHSEVQIDAATGAVLSIATRNSDWIESLHDGSWPVPWVHDYLMPVFALALLFLMFSGLWLWLEPLVRRSRRRRARRRA